MSQLVVRAIIPHKNTFLLVRHKHATYWCLPGGRVEPDEPIVQALERELVEELGVHPVVGQLLYVQQLFRSGEEDRTEFFFVVQNPEAFTTVDITKTTHGDQELDRAAFRTLHEVTVLPEYLAAELPTILQNDQARTLPLFRVSL